MRQHSYTNINIKHCGQKGLAFSCIGSRYGKRQASALLCHQGKETRSLKSSAVDKDPGPSCSEQGVGQDLESRLLAEFNKLQQAKQSDAYAGQTYSGLPSQNPLPIGMQQGREARDSSLDLQYMMGWLQANGVANVGAEDSPFGIFDATGGYRGLIAAKAIKEDDVILQVPTRMAIHDSPKDQAFRDTLYPNAPSSVRLAVRLLQQVRAGKQSPWYCYVRSLPWKIPSPAFDFTWEEIKQIEYPKGMADLYEYSYLVNNAHQDLRLKGNDNITSLEEFRWAMGCADSRSFGAADPEDLDTRIRVMMPLIDFLNHGGEETPLLLEGQPTATHNVTWDFAPGQAADGKPKWMMQIRATRDIEEGEELLISYGERSNDTFFLHYGFIPPRNPEDDYTLFESIEHALSWLEHQYPEIMQSVGYQQRRAKALELGEKELQEMALPPMDSPAYEFAHKMRNQQKVCTAARVSNSLMMALAVVMNEDYEKMEGAVARRAWECLATQVATPLCVDLAVLGREELREGDGQGDYSSVYFGRILKYYHNRGMLASEALQKPILGFPPATDTENSVELIKHAASFATYQPFKDPKHRLTVQEKLFLEFRVYKKMLLWDLIFKSPLKVRDLDYVDGFVWEGDR